MKEAAQLHADFCQALAEPTRIAILYEIDKGACSVNELVEHLGLPQATISRHLKVLREQSIVKTKREGSSIIYSLKFKRIIQVLEIMKSIKLDIIREEHNIIHEDMA